MPQERKELAAPLRKNRTPDVNVNVKSRSRYDAPIATHSVSAAMSFRSDEFSRRGTYNFYCLLDPNEAGLICFRIHTTTAAPSQDWYKSQASPFSTLLDSSREQIV